MPGSSATTTILLVGASRGLGYAMAESSGQGSAANNTSGMREVSGAARRR